MMYTQSTTEGFTLVEVLVSITIMLLVITGPMRVIVRANNTTAYSSEQVTAFFLAQEGLELAQKGRDDLMLSHLREEFYGSGIDDPWNDFLNTNFAACLVTGRVCGVSWNITPNPDTVAVQDCGAAAPYANCRLYINPSTSDRDRYTHDSSGGAVASPFTRTVRMDSVTAGCPAGRPCGVMVTSTVTWRTGSLIEEQSVELVTYLTNVYDTQ